MIKMPVDKFGRMPENSVTNVDGVSITYVNNNFIRRDGTNTATGSIDMTGNTLTNVSEPVNNQDAATKNYVDTNGGANKVDRSGDTMTGDLNFTFESQQTYTVGSGDILAVTGGQPVPRAFVMNFGDTRNNIQTLSTTNGPSGNVEPLRIQSHKGVIMDHFGTDVAQFGRDDTLPLDNTVYINHGASLESNKIINVADPTDPQDAATKAYVDNRVLRSGDTMTGALAVDTVNTRTDIDTNLTLTDKIGTGLIKLQPGGNDSHVYVTQPQAMSTSINDDSSISLGHTGSTISYRLGVGADGLQLNKRDETGPTNQRVLSINDTQMTMTGDLDMDVHRVRNVYYDAGSANDAVPKSYIDQELGNKLSNTGGIMSGDINMSGNSITALDPPVGASDATRKEYVDNALALKLDTSTFLVSRALPGVPIIDNLAVGLLPELTLVDADTADRVASMTDPVNGNLFAQTTVSRQPLLRYDNTLEKFYVRFDGVDDFLQLPGFTVAEVGGPNRNTTTAFLLVNTQTDAMRQSQFHWSGGGGVVNAHIDGFDGNIYIDYGSQSGNRLIVGGETGVTGSLELWTIRVNGTLIELFRGTSSLTPIGSDTLSSALPVGTGSFTIGAWGGTSSFCQMDLYAFAFYNVAFTDDQVKHMFRFFNSRYGV